MTQTPPPDLTGILTYLGRDATTRSAIIRALVEWEGRCQKNADGTDLRETLSGPIVDALYSGEPTITRRLKSGILFTMAYRSKIAREFAMGLEPLSHVWEPQTSRLLMALAKSAKTFVIGGAYAGDQAIPVAQVLTKHGGQVHCFELNPPQLAALEINVRQNSLTNVTINAEGLWDRSGFIELVGHDSHAFPIFLACNAPGAFPVTTIDAYAAASNIREIDCIMLDIEGGEESALRGAISFLEQPAQSAPDIVFEIHRSYVDWSNGLALTSPVKLLTDRGYSVYALRDYQAHVDMGNAPLEMVSLDSAYIEGPPHGFNLFATKSQQRLSTLGVKLRNGVSPKLLRHRLSSLHQPG